MNVLIIVNVMVFFFKQKAISSITIGRTHTILTLPSFTQLHASRFTFYEPLVVYFNLT